MATKLPPSTALRAMRGGGRIPHTRSDLQLTVELCRATLGEEKGRGTAGGGGAGGIGSVHEHLLGGGTRWERGTHTGILLFA